MKVRRYEALAVVLAVLLGGAMCLVAFFVR